MKKYELMLILEAAAKEAEKNAMIEKIKSVLEASKSTNVVVDIWGNKKFAYPINYKNEGYYALISFEANSNVPMEIENLLKVAENVVRYMCVTKE